MISFLHNEKKFDILFIDFEPDTLRYSGIDMLGYSRSKIVELFAKKLK